MADTVKRDILIRIRTEAENAGVDSAEARLIGLEQRIKQLNGKLTIKSNAKQVGQDLQGVAKDASQVASTMGKGMQEFEKQTKRSVEGLREVRREIKTLESGDIRTSILARGPQGSGVSVRTTQETGASVFTLDKERAAREQEAFIRGRQKVRLDAEKELEKIRAGIRKHDQEMGRIQEQANRDNFVRDRNAVEQSAKIHEAALRDDVIRGKKAANQQAQIFEQATREDISRTKAAIAEKNKLFDQASQENLIRGRHQASFSQLSRLPGVTEGLGPQRITKSGALVQDRVLFDQAGNQIARLNAETGKASVTMDRFGREVQQTGDTLQSAAAKVLLWTAATGALFGAVRAIRAGTHAFIEAEAATIRLERVGRGFGESQEQISIGARNVTAEILRQAVALGQDASEAQEAAVVFARLGLDQREVAEATRVAMLAANVAGIGAAEAAQLLASAMSQFHLSASDLPGVLDKLNTLENTTRVRTEDLLQAIARGGAVWREAGGSLEELAGVTAVVAETTSRSGAEIGNAFKTIASRLADPVLQGKIFKETGINIRTAAGELLPITELMGDLVVKFVELSQAEQAEVTTQIAGIRQRNILQTSLDNFFKSQSQVIRQLNGMGSAEEENQRILSQLDTKLKQLTASFERLAVTIGDSGLGTVLKKLIDLLTFVIDSLAGMGSAGTIVVAMLALYVGGVVAASIWTTKLSGSTGILAGSFKALARGAAEVDAFLLRTVGLLEAETVAANQAAAANLRLAAARAAGTVTRHTGFAVAGAASAAETVGGGLVSFLKGPAGVIAGAAIGIAVVSTIINKFRDKSVFDEDSGAFKSRDAARKQTTAAENVLKADETRIKTLSTIQNLLLSIEEREASGQNISTGASHARAQAYDFLRDSIELTKEELAKLNEEGLKSADIVPIIDRLQAGIADAKKKQAQSLDNQLAIIDSQLKGLEAERQSLLDNNVEGFRTPSGGFESLNPFERNTDEVDKDRNELLKEREGIIQRIAELEKNELEQSAKQLLADAEARTDALIEELRLKREIADIRSGVFDVDDLDRARSKIKSLSEEIIRLQESLDKPGVDREKIQKEIDKLRPEVDKAGAQFGAAQNKKDIEQIATNEERALRAKQEALRIQFSVGNELDREVNLNEELLADLKARLKEQQRLVEFNRGSPVHETAARREELKLLEQVDKAEQELENARDRRAVAEQRRTFERNLSRNIKLQDALAGVGAVEGPEQSRGIRDAAALILVERQRLEALKNDLANLRRGHPDTDESRIEIGLKEEAVAQSEERLQERILGLELAKIEAAKRLTEERQRQIEQTRKEIAGMSDLELLRTRIFAAEIKSGRAKPVSQEEFLGLDQETRRFLLKQGELFPGANTVPEFNLGLGPGAFQKNVQGVPSPEQLKEIFQNLNILAPAEFRGTIANAVLEGQTVTVNMQGQQDVPASAQALNFTFNFGGIETQADRIVGLIGVEFESRMQALINAKIAEGERKLASLPPGFRPGVRTG